MLKKIRDDDWPPGATILRSYAELEAINADGGARGRRAARVRGRAAGAGMSGGAEASSMSGARTVAASTFTREDSCVYPVMPTRSGRKRASSRRNAAGWSIGISWKR